MGTSEKMPKMRRRPRTPSHFVISLATKRDYYLCHFTSWIYAVYFIVTDALIGIVPIGISTAGTYSARPLLVGNTDAWSDCMSK